MEYLTRKDVLLIHSIIIDETGGSHGVRDHHAILVLEDLPRQAVFGKELYPTIYLKAALYARNIIMSHPFIDGNKRTGATAASVFLENNGHKITAQKGEIEKFTLRIVKQKLDLEEIADWFKKHSRKI
ncbi:type II toxin-antitoxin system death-on-curing family toxin [Candidatus Wolfebacteria bacterium]|nr:type II toxin-antitoxin system death-on-curing family toxin [Candidatus Wolfebacteria bacterium]